MSIINNLLFFQLLQTKSMIMTCSTIEISAKKFMYSESVKKKYKIQDESASDEEIIADSKEAETLIESKRNPIVLSNNETDGPDTSMPSSAELNTYKIIKDYGYQNKLNIEFYIKILKVLLIR
jgi:hypothetical protein